MTTVGVACAFFATLFAIFAMIAAAIVHRLGRRAMAIAIKREETALQEIEKARLEGKAAAQAAYLKGLKDAKKELESLDRLISAHEVACCRPKVDKTDKTTLRLIGAQELMGRFHSECSPYPAPNYKK